MADLEFVTQMKLAKSETVEVKQGFDLDADTKTDVTENLNIKRTLTLEVR